MSLKRLLLPLLPLALVPASSCVAATPRPMNRETCAVSRICMVHGTATAQMGEHAPIVKLDLDDGRCVNVSVPPERWEQLRQSGPREMTLVGDVYREPPAQEGEEAVLQINGRTIGFGLCGSFFVFVRQ